MKEIAFNDNASLETALSEKQVMSKFSHKHVCRYVDSFVANGHKLYLIMEYCDKGDLQQYLQRTRDMAAASKFLTERSKDAGSQDLP